MAAARTDQTYFPCPVPQSIDAGRSVRLVFSVEKFQFEVPAYLTTYLVVGDIAGFMFVAARPRGINSINLTW